METAGSSNALDVSAPTHDLKYMLASNVNVSNFVSVKLSGCSNYDIWKAQMLCLIQSQELLHIIQEEVCLTKKYDNLVKGWIFGSLNQKVLKDFVKFESAREVWMELESSFDPPISDAQGDPETEDLKYKQASRVRVSHFVSAKPSSRSNYKIWKAQMHSLIKSQGLLHIIDDEYPFPEDKGVHRIKEYDQIVRDWIRNSVWRTVNVDAEYIYSARAMWTKLESLFKPTIRDARTEELKYIQASNVNVSNFVTVKLSGHRNYDIWKAQMICLIESQALLSIIDASYPFPEDKGFCMFEQYEKLVRGWIYGSMNKELFEEKLSKDSRFSISTRYLWSELKRHFSSPERESDTEVIELKFGIELLRDPPETENIDNNSIIRKRLYEATVEGCWWKAHSILKIRPDAATEPITPNGNTILHLAVEMGHNYFLEKLLEFLKDGNKIETINDKGRTALHIAAVVGNEYAAQLLVHKRQELLIIRDSNRKSPLDICYSHCRKSDTYAYLLKSTISSDLNPHLDAWSFISDAIFTKQYDLARTLLEKHPEDANDIRLLFAIAQSFPTDLGYMESFIYPSFDNVRQNTFERASLLFHYNFWDKYADDVLRIVKICDNTCYSWLGNISIILVVPIAAFYPIYQLFSLLIVVLHLAFSMLYFLLWKVLAVTVPAIKNVEKTKKEYNVAYKTLSLICDKMVISNNVFSEILSFSEETTFEAVALDAYEVVDAILYTQPDALNWINAKGHSIIQLATINRSEKVFNLIHHIIERTESYKTMTDSSKNNLAHLAGRLAPSSVLSRTTGAALQLQRELIWREEVEKLISPEELTHMNVDKETPAMVFTREHADLLKEGENWMKTTAESCSITAALITTVVFAAAITVPGGSNQDSGIPLFKKDTAFTVFAVFNAFSLFTAATSLLLFLSILTARFSEKDFRLILPRRLILGLLTLFLSTTAMIIAFGAILFLVLCDHRPWMLVPICGFACLPISVIVTVKVPLLVDFIRSTYIPIFGKQSYLDSCKTNRKNTIFTY